MSRYIIVAAICVLGLVAATALLSSAAPLPRAAAAEKPAGAAFLDLTATIPLPAISGRVDHMAADAKGKRLFVVSLGKGSVEVIDLAAAKVIDKDRITGLKEPHDVLYMGDLNLLAVSSGKDGTVRLFDATTLKPTKVVDFKTNADGLRYDAAAKRIYVGHGDGGIGIIDPVKGEPVGEIPLKGHPESFQLERKGDRLFVNVPTERHIAVIDRKSEKVIDTWPIADATDNFAMALDEANRRLFVVARHPSEVLVYNTDSGKQVARFRCVGDCDDIFFDPPTGNLYLSGGEGYAEVFHQDDPDRYLLVARIVTAKLARTSLLVPDLGSFYVAVPHFIPWLTGKSSVRVYKVQTVMAAAAQPPAAPQSLPVAAATP